LLRVSEVAERSAVAIASRLRHELLFEARIDPPDETEIPTDAPVRNAADLLAEEVPA